jgi:hypothetical protein
MSSYTRQNLIDMARDLIEEPVQSEVRDATNMVRWGTAGDRFLLLTLPREFLGSYGLTKTWSLTTSTSVYSYTITDSFTGILDLLEVNYTTNTAAGSWRSGTQRGLELRPGLYSGILIHVSEELPSYILDGQNLEIFPVPAAAVASGLKSYHRGLPAIWDSTLTTTWLFSDLAADAMAYHLVSRAKFKLKRELAQSFEVKRNLEVLGLWEKVGRRPPAIIASMLAPPK